MAKIKEGFKGERLVSMPEKLLEDYRKEPLIAPLYVRKIGYFPRVKYHYVQKNEGTNYAMLIYCTEGEGWYSIQGKTFTVHRNQYILIPPHVPYAFGEDEDNPWTIYWLHFEGELAKCFLPQRSGPVEILPGDYSRLQYRLHLFEEILNCFAMGYIKEYMIYASMCLHQFLASFMYIEQFRHSAIPTQKEYPFIAKVTHYMNENIHQNLTLEELATYFKYSPSHFSALFRKETGVSPIHYYIRLKIQKACEYIELSDLKLSEIATRLGFEDASYFSRIFTHVMGISPSRYRTQEVARRKTTN